MELTDSERETHARNYTDLKHRKKTRSAGTEQDVRDAYAANNREERYAIVFAIVILIGVMIWKREAVTPAVLATALVGILILFAISRIQLRLTEVMIRMQTLQEVADLLEEELATANEAIEQIRNRMM